MPASASLAVDDDMNSLQTAGAGDLLSRFFRLDGTGTRSMKIDGSAVDKVFSLDPPVNEVWVVEHMSMVLGAASVDPGKYGNLGVLADDGTLFQLRTESTLFHDFLDGEEILTTTQWSQLDGNSQYQGGPVISSVTMTIDASDFYGKPIEVDGSLKHQLQFTVRAALQTLTEHHVYARGKIRAITT